MTDRSTDVAEQSRSADGSDQTVPVDGVWIVIAAYNEDRAIGQVLEELQGSFRNVIVVDDGSRDATSEVARSAGALVVTHPVNLGQGAALKTGVDAALLLGADYLVTFDADGQHRPEDVHALLGALTRSGAHVALGDRFAGTSPGMPRSRRLLLRLARRFTSLTTGVSVSDPHNGLRAFTASAVSRLRIRQNGMAHASEIIAEIGRLDLSVVEVPVEVRYTEYSRNKGQEGLDAINILLDLATGRLNR